MHFLCVAIMLSFFICLQILTCQALHEVHQRIVLNVVSILQEQYSVGLMLVSFGVKDHETVNEDMGIFRNLALPYAIIDNQNRTNITTSRRCFKSQQGKPYFVHLNPQLHSTLKSAGNKPWYLWKQLYLQLLGYPEETRWLRSQESMDLFSPSVFERFIFKDILLFTVENSFNSFHTKVVWPFTRSIVPRNSIWFFINYFETCKAEFFSKKIPANNVKAHLIQRTYGNTMLCPSNKTTLHFLCPTCSDKDVAEVNAIHSNVNFTNSTFYYKSQRLSSLGLIISQITTKMKNNSMKIYLKNSLQSNSSDKRKSFRISIKNRFIGSTNEILYDSLIFIARRPSSPADNISNVVLGPFTIGSWLGIVFAYALSAIAFGIVKALTWNNLDESLHEYIMHQLARMINNDNKSNREKMTFCKRTGSDDYIFENDDDGTLMPAINPSTTTSDILDAELRSTIKGKTLSILDNNESNDAGHGKASKAILHGTIRIVSFVLIATYEGNLYSTITFPKSRLVSTFEELVTSDKYAVKVTTEAEQSASFSMKYANNIAKNYSIMENYNENTKDDTHIDSNYNLDKNNTAGNLRKTLRKSKNSNYGINIEECINWVESNPNSNHACIGYEFELRNLHKTQKFDKLIAKSNKKLSKYGIRNYGGRQRLRLFPGAFQISKWILESGIMQLWNLAENSFAESFGDGKFNHSKVFTITDYIGLFIFYFVLLFISLVLFVFEVGLRWTKPSVVVKSIKCFWQYITQVWGTVLQKFPRNFGIDWNRLRYTSRRHRMYVGQLINC